MNQSRRALLGLSLASLGVLGSSRRMAAWAQSPENIRVGVLTSMTGGGASYGSEMNRMFHLVADEINGQGGVLGRKLELFTEDDETNPDSAVRAVQKLVDINKVNMVVGVWSSACALAVIPILVRARIPLFTVGSSPLITTFPDDDLMFRTAPSDALVTENYIFTAKRKNWRSASLFILNTPYGHGMADTFTPAFQKIGGKITAQVVYDLNQTSYRSEIEQAFAGSPDVVLFGGFTPDGVQIFREAYRLGKTGTWLMPGFVASPQFLAGLDPAADEGTYAIDAVPNDGSSAFKHAGDIYTAASGKPASQIVYEAYDHLMIMCLAILAAKGDSSGDAIKTHIRAIANPPGQAVGTWAEALPLVTAGQKINYEGASGSCDFDANGDTVPNFGVFRIVGGKRVLDFKITAADLKAG